MVRLTDIAISIVLAVGASCATAGRQFDHSALNNFEVGATTEADVISQFGSEPTHRSFLQDETYLAHWAYVVATSAQIIKNKAISIHFDRNGVLKGVVSATDIDVPPSVRPKSGFAYSGRQLGVACENPIGAGQFSNEVTRVVPGSHAESVGIKVGDMITAVDGVEISTSIELSRELQSGSSAKTLTLRRSEDILAVGVDLASADNR